MANWTIGAPGREEWVASTAPGARLRHRYGYGDRRRVSFFAQGDERIDAGGALRGNIASEKRDAGKNG